MIHYKIGSSHPAAHYFDISLHIPQPDPRGQLLRLPAWIPGSYMIRDFAKNIIELEAYCAGQPLALTQLDKSSWRLAPCSDAVEVKYRVYAWDLSVRSAHLDTTHGFFNGTSVFLEVVGQADQPCEVMILQPTHKDCTEWRLATTLPRKDSAADPDDFSFGLFEAENYQALIDHPVEMGLFEQFQFEACGLRHDVILTGQYRCDKRRLQTDLVRICEQHIRMFGEPAPMPRYMFLVMVVGEGYGGLEHRSSTSLLCSRGNLPQPGQDKMTEEYRSFLGLCSHEYFHSWNVKRIKPGVFDNPDLSTEVYTPLLWAFEGITSYYDDLALLRSGCIEQQDYLELLGQTITRVQRGRGRQRQSAAESSFNSWTKFYQQDENAANAIVSYYAKGSLIALCIDLKIRQLTDDKKSLDDVMRSLWADYLRQQQGIEEHDIQQTVNRICDADLSDFLHRLIYQTGELPLAELLQTAGIALEFRASSGVQDKGGKASDDVLKSTIGANVKEENHSLRVVSLTEDGAGQQAGMSAGDEIIAINKLRCSIKSYHNWLELSEPGSEHELSVFRRDELMRITVALQPAPLDSAYLSASDDDHASRSSWPQATMQA